MSDVAEDVALIVKPDAVIEPAVKDTVGAVRSMAVSVTFLLPEGPTYCPQGELTPQCQ